MIPPQITTPRTSPDERVPSAEHGGAAWLAKLFREGSRLTEPAEVVRHFGGYFRRLRPSPLFVSVSRRGLDDGRYKITRWLPDDMRQRVESGEAEPPDPWRDWDALPIHQGGLIGEIIDRGEPRVLHNLDLTHDAALGDTLAWARSCMAVPNYDNGEALYWSLWFYAEPQGPGPDVLEAAIVETNLLGMSTKNLVSRRRAESLAAQLRNEMEEIANIQRSLLPQKLPRVDGVELATSYLTSDQAGGDYYDAKVLSDGRLGVLIADVSGHGPAAATVMAMLRTIVHTYEDVYGAEHPDAADVVDFTNRRLMESNLVGNFVTAYFMMLDPTTGRFESALCGHNPPRLRRPDGTIVPLDEGATVPLGVREDIDAHTACRTLEPGDTLVLYTDGITEAFGRPDPLAPGGPKVMFGTERLDNAIAACSGRPQCVIDSVYNDLYRHTGSYDRDDDQTIVAIRFEPGPGRSA